jgi:hypothetical protein
MNREELKKEAQEQVNYCTPLYPECFIQGYLAGAEPRENKIADIKANCDLAIEGRDIKIKELEQQIEKMKRHCNCKHRDGEGYCEVKRTYLMDLSYDGCDKWELED